MDMEAAVAKLIEDIDNDYRRFQASSRKAGINEDILKNMEEEFVNSTKIKYGSKYIRIIKNGSMNTFIVNTDKDKKFKRGDILKPAGYSAPARNAARGNVFTGYTIRWTGPGYLK
jgi:hypothetical protein